MLITVIIPTYRRPKDLLRCLNGLTRQTRTADEVIVIVRDSDVETWASLEAFEPKLLPLKTLKVKVPGVVAAMNLGLIEARGDILAFTDDDSVPHVDWLERIERYYLSDPSIGGVGGRDYVYRNNVLEEGYTYTVGRLSWFGRMTGNHHIGVGKEREVDFLKGVNMSFRKTAIGDLVFDERMRGTGAQVHLELAFCLEIKKKNWKLIYDPQVAVDHYPAKRFDEDQRNSFNESAVRNAVHNETLALLNYLPHLNRRIFLVWSLVIGTKQSFGLAQYIRFLLKGEDKSSQKLLSSLRGRIEGWKTWRSASGLYESK